MVETGSITSFESYEDARAHVSKALLASINAVQTQHADSLEGLGPTHQRAISQVFGAINKTVWEGLSELRGLDQAFFSAVCAMDEHRLNLFQAESKSQQRDQIERIDSKSRRTIDETRRAAQLMTSKLSATHKHRLEAAQRSLDEQKSKMELDLQEERREMTAQSEQDKLLVRGMEKIVSKKQEELDAALAEIAPLRRSAMKYDKACAEIEKMGTAANRLTLSMRRLEDEHKQCQTTIQTVEGQRDFAERELKRANTVIAELQAKGQKMANLLSEASAEVEQLQAEKLQLQQTHEAALRAQQEAAAVEQCPPEESEEPLQQQLDEANRNLERLHGEMEDIHIQHQSALEQLRAEYASELQASVDRVVAQHEAAMKQATHALDMRIAELETSRRKLKQQLDYEGTCRAEMQEQTAELMTENDGLRRQIQRMEEDAEVAAAMADAEKPKKTSNKSSKSKSRVKQTSRPKSVVSGRLMQGRVILGCANSASPQLLRGLHTLSQATAFLEFSTPKRVLGMIKIELLASELPRTCQNFAALCTGEHGVGKSGRNLWLKGTPLHRIIPGFLVQGGDVTNGDGSGGESIYGSHFEDEGFVVSHDRAGVLSMANSGPDHNNSQFFITLGPCQHLDDKNVAFGFVVEGNQVVQSLAHFSKGASGDTRELVTISDCGML